MNNDILTPTEAAAPLSADAAEAAQASVGPAHPQAAGFNIGRLRVRYLKSSMEMGWGHDEGDSTSRTLFEMSNIYEGERRTAFRLLAGKHSLWFFF